MTTSANHDVPAVRRSLQTKRSQTQWLFHHLSDYIFGSMVGRRMSNRPLRMDGRLRSVALNVRATPRVNGGLWPLSALHALLRNATSIRRGERSTCRLLQSPSIRRAMSCTSNARPNLFLMLCPMHGRPSPAPQGFPRKVFVQHIAICRGRAGDPGRERIDLGLVSRKSGDRECAFRK